MGITKKYPLARYQSPLRVLYNIWGYELAGSRIPATDGSVHRISCEAISMLPPVFNFVRLKFASKHDCPSVSVTINFRCSAINPSNGERLQRSYMGAREINGLN